MSSAVGLACRIMRLGAIQLGWVNQLLTNPCPNRHKYIQMAVTLWGSVKLSLLLPFGWLAARPLRCCIVVLCRKLLWCPGLALMFTATAKPRRPSGLVAASRTWRFFGLLPFKPSKLPADVALFAIQWMGILIWLMRPLNVRNYNEKTRYAGCWPVNFCGRLC